MKAKWLRIVLLGDSDCVSNSVISWIDVGYLNIICIILLTDLNTGNSNYYCSFTKLCL